MVERIDKLVHEIQREPFTGIGKPEPLQHASGFWSRRITDEHRMVYKVAGGAVLLAQLRFHYRHPETRSWMLPIGLKPARHSGGRAR